MPEPLPTLLPWIVCCLIAAFAVVRAARSLVRLLDDASDCRDAVCPGERDP